MRYACLNCGHRFALEEQQEGDKKVRCPSCLRVTGIEKIEESPARAPRTWMLGVIVGLLVVAVAGYAVWRAQAPRTVGDTVPERGLASDELAGHLQRLHVDPGPLGALLVPHDSIEEFARAAGGGSHLEKAQAIYEALRARASAQAFVRWSLGTPRDTPIAPAGDAWAQLAEEGARAKLYPLEAAAILVAAFRSQGIAAMVAEVWGFPGDDAPPDPSGHFGYFVAAAYESEAGEGDAQYFDAWGGHQVAPDPSKVRVLNDIEAVGAALNIRAIHLLVRENDPSRALDASRDALRLDGRSPSARSVRGAILITSGGGPQGVEEFRAANQIRADAPRHQQLAGVYLAQGDVEQARRELSASLAESPDYAVAHGALAAVHLAEGESDLAREELETASRLDPDLHTLSGLWAGYYATVGELDRAVASARTAVERNPWDLQTRLMAARIYRQAAQYDEMRQEARTVLELAPAGRRSETEQLIRRLLGPTALEDPLADLEDDEEESELEGDLELDEELESESSDLRLDTSGGLLGTEDDSSPSLLDEDETLGGPGLGAPGGSGLRLAPPGGGSGLRLNLGD